MSFRFFYFFVFFHFSISFLEENVEYSDELQHTLRITAEIANIHENMLKLAWIEWDFRFDILCVTNGSHVEYLYF